MAFKRELVSVPGDDVLGLIPDTPSTVEFRSLAETNELLAYRSAGGWLLAHTGGRLAGALGPVLAEDVRALYQARGWDCDLLADEAACETLQAAFRFERAVIQTLAGPWRMPRMALGELTIRPLETADPLDHVDDALREELEFAQRRTRVLAGDIDGLPVSFAYVVASAAHADLSIDTVPAYRRRGIATAVAAALVDQVVATGKTPVWGAVESNLASLAIAARLGFARPAGVLYVAEEPLAPRVA